MNIVRVLVTKMRSAPPSGSIETPHHEAAKAIKATLILFPLLGITNLLFFINPKEGAMSTVYVVFNATLQSSQVCVK